MRPSESSYPALGWNRLDGIDLLRGFAIFFVLMNHVNMRLLIAKVPIYREYSGACSYLPWCGTVSSPSKSSSPSRAFLLRQPRCDAGDRSPTSVNVRDFLSAALRSHRATLHSCADGFEHSSRRAVQGLIVKPKTGGLGRALLAALTFHVNVLEANRGYLPGSWDVLWSLSVEEMFIFFSHGLPDIRRTQTVRRFFPA